MEVVGTSIKVILKVLSQVTGVIIPSSFFLFPCWNMTMMIRISTAIWKTWDDMESGNRVLTTVGEAKDNGDMMELPSETPHLGFFYA